VAVGLRAGPTSSFATAAVAHRFARVLIGEDVIRRQPGTVEAWALVAGLMVYSIVALAAWHWWVSGLGALVTAVLLWRRHRRARFAAYVLLSLIVLRALVSGAWMLAALGAAGVLVLQSPGARQAWPRLSPGWRRGRAAPNGGDTMARP
jgi:hypothetical protein